MRPDLRQLHAADITPFKFVWQWSEVHQRPGYIVSSFCFNTTVAQAGSDPGWMYFIAAETLIA
jgi:hypothetical protein